MKPRPGSIDFLRSELLTQKFTEPVLGLYFSRCLIKTECNGEKYSPLGCFTDDFPFHVVGYRPGMLNEVKVGYQKDRSVLTLFLARMPSSIATVNPTFRLTNRAYTVSGSKKLYLLEIRLLLEKTVYFHV